MPASCALCVLGAVDEGSWIAINGTVSTNSATYSEVGSFAARLEDHTFAAVDAADSSDTERFVLSAVFNVGRFVPNHFVASVLNISPPLFQTFNTANASCSLSPGITPRTFTYIGQPFGYDLSQAEPLPKVLLAAQNFQGGQTLNYSQALWKITAAGVTQTYTDASLVAIDHALVSAPTVTPKHDGTGEIVSSATDKIAIVRNVAAPQAALIDDISLSERAQDSSENAANQSGAITTALAATFSGIAFDSVDPVSGQHQFRYGRLKLSNAYGAEVLALSVEIRTEYWDAASDIFVPNVDDYCTRIQAGNILLRNHIGGISPANLSQSNVDVAGNNPPGTFMAGVGKLRLTRPVPVPVSRGSADICVDLSTADTSCSAAASANMSYLQGAWSGAEYDDDPAARATFGVYQGSNQIIYMREAY